MPLRAATAAALPALAACGCNFTSNIVTKAQPGSAGGYTLIAPDGLSKVYLAAPGGEVVHMWDPGFIPGQKVFLNEAGTLVHSAFDPDSAPAHPQSCSKPPAGGVVQLVAWNGSVTWQYKHTSAAGCAHHDVIQLPNGNVMFPVWEAKTVDEAAAAGSTRDKAMIPDSIMEVRPTGAASGEVVWEWHLWDHLIQDADSSKANYGDVSAHPELMDINAGGPLGGPGGKDYLDWNHMNALDYNAELDQVAMSLHNQGEVLIIDHSCSTEEAKGHAGCRSGRGGDILYRWGNPANYGRGADDDKQLDGQHNIHWVSNDVAGAPKRNMLVYDNYAERQPKKSSVKEIELPQPAADGTYPMSAKSSTGAAVYGPSIPAWDCCPFSFFSAAISGSQRLPNNNTLIDQGMACRLMEVTPAGDVVWEFDEPAGWPMGGCFRAYRYSESYPGLKGRDLTPVTDAC